jgi:hypothetical protein
MSKRSTSSLDPFRTSVERRAATIW